MTKSRGSQEPELVVISNESGESTYEAEILRGALWHHGIGSVVCALSDAHNSPARFVVAMPQGVHQDELVPSRRPDQFLVYAGRFVSAGCCRLPRTMVNATIIAGEPYSSIVRLVSDSRWMAATVGRRVTGDLLDLRHYTTAPPLDNAHIDLGILTSLGCQKRCGYCSYAATYPGLYGSDAERRPRPWSAITGDVGKWSADGRSPVRLVADQFLSRYRQENEDLFELGMKWRSRAFRPTVSFTVGPRELVNNLDVIEALVAAFDVRPTLSLDSFDTDFRRALALDFTAQIAMSAVKALTTRRLALRVNYILLRPSLTGASLDRELGFFEKISELTTYLDRGARALLAFDLFSGALQWMPGAPICHSTPPDARVVTPSARRLAHALETVVSEMLSERHSGIDLLDSLIAATKSLVRSESLREAAT